MKSKGLLLKLFAISAAGCIALNASNSFKSSEIAIKKVSDSSGTYITLKNRGDFVLKNITVTQNSSKITCSPDLAMPGATIVCKGKAISDSKPVIVKSDIYSTENKKSLSFDNSSFERGSVSKWDIVESAEVDSGSYTNQDGGFYLKITGENSVASKASRVFAAESGKKYKIEFLAGVKKFSGLSAVAVKYLDKERNPIKGAASSKKIDNLIDEGFRKYTLMLNSAPKNAKYILIEAVSKGDTLFIDDIKIKEVEISKKVSSFSKIYFLKFIKSANSMQPLCTCNGQVGDTVWYDRNRNGYQDSDEFGIKGVKVYAYKDGRVVKSTYTDASGHYKLTHLCSGYYKFKFVLPKGWKFTKYTPGFVNGKSSAKADGWTETKEVCGNSRFCNIDAGVYKEPLFTCPAGYKKFVLPYDKKLYYRSTTLIDISSEFNGKLNGYKRVIIKNAYTWDGYVNRKNTRGQKRESVRVVFVDRNGNRYSTGYSDDVEDYVDFADKITPYLGIVYLKSGAEKVLVAHVSDSRYGDGDHSSANSVYFKGFCYRIENLANAKIDIEKYTNGADADSGTGPVVEAGSTVTWKYIVKNRGNVKLTNVVVKDDKEGTICTIASLNPSQFKICTKTGKAKAGQYVNIATVTGRDPQGNIVSDKDPSRYFGVKPCIDVEKSTNGQDADSGTGPVINEGDKVVWSYVIKNVGNVKLTDIKLVDNKEGVIKCPKNSLNVNESMVCKKEGKAKAGQYENVATVTAKDLSGKTVKESDKSHYFGKHIIPANPALDLEKHTNGQDADIGTGPAIRVGEKVTWEYIVKNTGNVKLTGITVTDDKEGVVCKGFDLAPGEKRVCIKTAKAKEGQYENHAIASGKSPSGKTVKDTDTSHYLGKNPNTASIGDYVWYDKNANGVQDSGERGIKGVKVQLFKDGKYTGKETVTDSSGKYIFKNLAPGNYSVKVIKPRNYPYFTLQNQGGNDAKDSDVNPDNGMSSIVRLKAGEAYRDLDAGLVCAACSKIDIEKLTNGVDADSGTGPVVAVGSKVTWKYIVKNSGNAKLSNIVLKDSVEGTVKCPKTVLAAGESMTCIKTGIAKAGQYENIATVTGKPPVGKTVSDKDPSHYFGGKPGIDVEKSTNGADADSGTGPVVAVGSTVTWKYVVKNRGNVKLTNVVVKDDKEGTICTIASLNPGESKTCTKTGKAKAGQYANIATATGKDPQGHFVSDKDPSHYFGGKSAIDIEKYTNGQDADSGTGPIIPVGESVTWKYVVTNKGNMVLKDIVVTDSKEGNICKIKSLAPGKSATCSKTGSAKEGQYENIATVTAIDPQGNSVSDKDPSHYFGGSSCISIQKSTNDEDADSGTGPVVPVGSTVTWKYVVKNTGNLILKDVVVRDDKEGTICSIASLNPGAVKSCTKTGIAKAGQYENNATVTAKDPTGKVVKDYDPSHYFGGKPGIDVEKSTNGADADSGTGPVVAVGSTVTWKYVVKNRGNVKLTNVVVKDDKEGTICTIASLNPGESKACTKTGKAKAGQYENTATVTAEDENGNSVSDKDPSHYYGKKLACLGDFVWLDYNSNGIQDSGESGIAGAKVELLDRNGNRAKDFYGHTVAPQTTGSDGKYRFCKLSDGKYIVKVTPPSGYVISPKDQGGNDAKDSDVSPATGKTELITVPEGANKTDVDAGVYKPVGCLGNFIWLDKNANGIQDAGEKGVKGAKVELLDENGNPARDAYGDPVGGQITGSSGEYKFCKLAGGKYIVKVTPPSGYKISPKDQGGNDAKDSDIDPKTGKTDLITLPDGASDMSWDGGLYKPEGCLGNFVWLDDNANGIQDASEKGVKGAKVELLDINGNPARDTYGDLVAPQTTGDNGEYKFCKLAGGKYIVKVTPPNGYIITDKNAGINDEKDSDIDPKTGKSAIVELPEGENDMSWDAGLYKPACIGDIVWLDYDGNGIQDANSQEHGIEGAVVTLLDANGNAAKDINGNSIAPVTTGADGKYQFCSLKPGTYKVKMLKDDDLYYVTYKDRGSDESKDSDINPSNYTTDPVVLHSGEFNRNVDAGYFKCGSLFGVYSVINMGMGAYSVDSSALEGLRVEIYDENGELVKELTTDKFGRFHADNLLPGKYKVVFQKPEGMKFAKDKTVYVTVRAGQKDIKVENSIVPQSASDEEVKRELDKRAKELQAKSEAKVYAGGSSSMSALTPVSMLLMLFAMFTLAKRKEL